MKTLVGEGAVFVSPNDVNSIREGFIKAIELEDTRTTIIEQGLVNAKRYSAQAVTNLYNNCYQLLKILHT